MLRSCRAGQSVWRQQQIWSGPGQFRSFTATPFRAQDQDSFPSQDANSANSANLAEPSQKAQVEESNVPLLKKRQSDGKGLPYVEQIRRFRVAEDKQRAAQREAPEGKGRVIFSAIQPTGVPHLGNYLGALREWKRLQDTAPPEDRLIFCIVDLHAITVPRPREDLVGDTTRMMAALLAVGLDPERSTIFLQSRVYAISELQWILSCTASTGYLSRMTQWKSKMQLGEDADINDAQAKRGLKHGLFSYPVLMAADILIHGATHVPVGEDQSQHLEFARECVTNFNHTYKTEALVAPQTLISPFKRVMSLTDPTKKMSKSDPSEKSRILLSSSDSEIRDRIGRAVTDSTNSVTYDPALRPGVANLLELLSSFDPAGRTPEQLAKEAEGVSLGELKQAVSQAIIDEITPIRERYHEYLAHPQLLKDIEIQGMMRARRTASPTLRKVKGAIGLGRLGKLHTETEEDESMGSA